MKRERPYETAIKAWATDMRDIIAASLVVTKNAANADDHKTMTYTVMDLVQNAFKAGWDAAIDWCMQPEDGTGRKKKAPDGNSDPEPAQ